MAGLPMLLTAVLLHAAPSCTPVEARHEALPVNFGEAALAVVRCLNNVARCVCVYVSVSVFLSPLTSNVAVHLTHKHRPGGLLPTSVCMGAMTVVCVCVRLCCVQVGPPRPPDRSRQ